MRVGYGFRRDEKALRDAGAEVVWLDTSKERTERAAMAQTGLRAGDTLVLLSIRDLGGSAPADKQWRARLEAMGVSLEVVQAEVRPRGRPAQFKPSPEQDAELRRMWLDGLQSEKYRLRRCGEIYGRAVSKGQLCGRYGTPTSPKQ
ncbi:hypothetical protein [Phaeobacter gallaeciensis]|uniref:hypothetical protein n=1 Tax=Phaeobacter gallaeciensis TaxID=60890 RepID=UPI00237F818B|nr:hypothetical protein [Phaeobacter gallaeciensis]MDE4059752.1 hypothetical protein [Phaeobacter gallaeciensis]MDE4122611.1 hypothetical protein [Phaeobacter gallaeciensis]MDE4127239.1 hypothetical protein [Phaeobacter gallaeciensis]